MQREQPDVVLHGVLGGIVAGLVVVTWFVVIDLAASQPFQTPARLASVMLGEEFSGPWPRLIAMYTILHFGIFAMLGAAAAWFVRSIEVDPGLTLGVVFGVGVLNAVHYAGLLITGRTWSRSFRSVT